jgi:hypothetical protein
MLRVCLVILATIFFAPSCSAEKPVEFTDALLQELPSDPIDFQKQFGGEIEKLHADESGMEKGANIDRVNVKSKGFQATFYEFQKNKLWRIKLMDNTIRVGGIAVIGKTVEQIVELFGTPYQNDKEAVIYEANETTLILIPKDNRIISAEWGQIP